MWARFAGASCDWELRDDGESLGLFSLAVEPPPVARGLAPEPCRSATCVYYGADSVAGPLVLAVAPSVDSEMPAGVQLGVTTGAQLVFVDLWAGAGEPVVGDHTRLGPAHALGPFACGERLALLAVERLEAAAGLAPPPTLTVREGLLDPAAPDKPAGAVQRGECTPIALPVP